MRNRKGLPLVLGLLAAIWSQYAAATFHLWTIDQIYSNADGSVQYVDFVLPPVVGDDESHLLNKTLTSGLNNNTLTFGSDLPSTPVGGQHFLVATPGFAAIAGVQPDYTFAAPGPFFKTNGDTLNYASGVSIFTFQTLPLDGIHALNSDNSISLNAPTNFAGQTGFVPEPASWLVFSIGAIGLVVVLRRRFASQSAAIPA
jgi:serralysin